MSGLTYIIIILILISIFVTCSEVFLRFGILSARVCGVSVFPNMLASSAQVAYVIGQCLVERKNIDSAYNNRDLDLV